MGVHYYEESPSWPAEQNGRLGPPAAVINAGIPCVVFGEDALSIVHRVPTDLFDQHLLVPDHMIDQAINSICNSFSYSWKETDPVHRWNDFKVVNPQCPHAFNLNVSTKLLVHDNPESTFETYQPERILVHGASVFHFDIHDPSRTCLNPKPPFPQSCRVLFPTLPAFYDAYIDTYHEPPHPFVHMKFKSWINTGQAYLTQYTLSDKGITSKFESVVDADADASVSEKENKKRVIIPACLELINQVKEENRPRLIRNFLLMKPLDLPLSSEERMIIKAERYQKMNTPYHPPTIPWHPYFVFRNRPYPTEEYHGTPFLVRNAMGKLEVAWRVLEKLAARRV
ncbi:hypothetical protein D9758_017624 [Tetrapyrgos nigripes]|uniref:Uncharacterized protein n=1 Tax=Tetrapyrgos nigripes TaxID=182062 RepID=A0A8H5FLR3_9AGAR|nr:hypothetical protein D9758_017624 [Tetrapyrgos nigripes]